MSANLQILDTAPDLVERVREAIVQAIASGKMGEGEKFTQESIAQQLGVSRQPVLQALLVLRELGIVQDTPTRRGVVVSPLSSRLVEELYAVRTELEVLAATLAAQRCTDLQLERGRALVAEGSRLAREASRHHDDVSTQRLVHLDQALHAWILECADHQVLRDTMRLHVIQVRRVMTRYLRPPQAALETWREHAQIVEAIGNGQTQRAAQAVRNHIEQAARWVIAQSPSAKPSTPRKSTRRPAA
jgi:DNA-binding GntR family transcriptional regulator